MIAPPKPPSHDELELLIKEARERQLRRRLLGAAAVAIATAIGLSVYALAPGGRAPHTASKSGSSGGVPLCRASQLSASIGFQASTQMDVGAAEIENVSGSACSLSTTWPRVRLTTDGKPLAVNQRRPSGVSSGTPARVLAPGGRAEIELQWGNFCGTPHAPVSHGGEPLTVLEVDFAFQFGAGVAVTAATTGTPPCLGPSRSTLVVNQAERAG